VGVVARAAQPAADLDAVGSGAEADVEEDEVELGLGQRVERRAPVGRLDAV
jgi:hypothetical protein